MVLFSLGGLFSLQYCNVASLKLYSLVGRASRKRTRNSWWLQHSTVIDKARTVLHRTGNRQRDSKGAQTK